MKTLTARSLAATIFVTSACLISSCASKQPSQSKPTAEAKTVTEKAPEGPVTLKILSPKMNEVVTTGDVPVRFELTNYEVQPGGQHVHLILDNEPYQPCYTVKEPCVLKDVKPGAHTLRAFPSRAWHESIKDPGAFASVNFFVQKKKGKAPMDLQHDPLLTYSRPKGKYEGEQADKILFDFWIKNAELGKDKYQVRYKLDNDDYQTLSEWKPSYLDHLPAGKHKLVVELLDKDGKPVKGKYNHTEREFEVVKAPNHSEHH